MFSFVWRSRAVSRIPPWFTLQIEVQGECRTLARPGLCWAAAFIRSASLNALQRYELFIRPPNFDHRFGGFLSANSLNSRGAGYTFAQLVAHSPFRHFRRCVCYAVTVVTVVTVLEKGIPTPNLVLYIIYIIIYIIYRYKLSLFTNRFWNCNNCNTVTLSVKIILSFLNKVDSRRMKSSHFFYTFITKTRLLIKLINTKISFYYLFSRFLLLFLQT